MNAKYISFLGLLILGCNSVVDLGNRDGGAGGSAEAIGGSAAAGQASSSQTTGGRAATSARCGNGIIELGETCDDGSKNADNQCGGCSTTCQLNPHCGDAIVQTQCGEQCDFGTQNGAIGSDCTSDCRVATGTCGNGIIELDETCDDGNTLSGDGCSANCTIEAGWTCPTPGQPCVASAQCGDGIVESSEQCDDGNTVSGDGCSANCTIEAGWTCSGSVSVCVATGWCGDGIVQGTEQCDSGTQNGAVGSQCTSDCRLSTPRV